MRPKILFGVLILFFSACSLALIDNPFFDGGSKIPSLFTNNDYSTLITCSLFEAQKQTGVVQSKAIPELSGIAASRKNPGTYWVHNDSGNPSDIFLMDTLGNVLLTVFINNGANRDWEDICVGPGPDSTKSYVYVGEIGDNNSRHIDKSVLRLEEPALTSSVTQMTIDADIINFQYPDGNIYNAETLMIDPVSRDLYVATKGNSSNVYRMPYPQSLEKNTPIEFVANLPIYKVTAGDISGKGDEILIKSYTQIFYWKRIVNEDIKAMLNRKPLLIPYKQEVQGEAIGWNVSGTGFITSTEIALASEQKVFYYKRK